MQADRLTPAQLLRQRDSARADEGVAQPALGHEVLPLEHEAEDSGAAAVDVMLGGGRGLAEHDVGGGNDGVGVGVLLLLDGLGDGVQVAEGLEL
jgi:hypothetical protein